MPTYGPQLDIVLSSSLTDQEIGRKTASIKVGQLT